MKKRRTKVYIDSRGNLPVVSVLPSLEPGQAYEATVWIVQHPYGIEKHSNEIPIKVIYSAGQNFDVHEVTKEQSIHFTAKLTYWAPMLIQVKMIFSNDDEFITHVYARMPNQY